MRVEIVELQRKRNDSLAVVAIVIEVKQKKIEKRRRALQTLRVNFMTAPCKFELLNLICCRDIHFRTPQSLTGCDWGLSVSVTIGDACVAWRLPVGHHLVIMWITGRCLQSPRRVSSMSSILKKEGEQGISISVDKQGSHRIK